MRRGFLNLPFEYETEVIGEITIVPSTAQGPVDDAAREILNDIARRIGPVANVVRMTHDLRRSSERLVLARAVRWHLEDRVLVDEGKTVVFA